MNYHPPQEILEKYAHVLVRCALGGGKGIQPGEVVLLQVPECAKPMLLALQHAVLEAGGHYVTHYLPDGTERGFFERATDAQLTFFPEKLLQGRIDQIDHSVFIIAEHDKTELEGIPPARIMARSRAFKPYMEWRDAKEQQGRFTWTLALYGTESSAREAGLSLEAYWDEIIRACYLDLPDPVAKWRDSLAEVGRVKDALNALAIERVHVEAEGVDLWIGLGKERRWMGGSGRNIPSFEVFISPDWRATEGTIAFDQPLYRYGSLIEGIRLRFEKGEVVEAHATKGEEVLKAMLASDAGAKRVGEFSLTDVRLSRITRFMAETLFDENFGGEYGNTHIALGKAYTDSYPGDATSLTKEQWAEKGYNDSAVHTDIVSTKNRTVTAFLGDGTTLVLYAQGRFLL